MKTLIAYLVALIAALGLSPMTAKVVDLDYPADTVTVETATGHLYAFHGCEDYCVGDYVSAIVWKNRTDTMTDDVILSVHYAGYCDYAE